MPAYDFTAGRRDTRQRGGSLRRETPRAGFGPTFSRVSVAPYDLTKPPGLRPWEVKGLRVASGRFAKALGPLLTEYIGQRFNAHLWFAGQVEFPACDDRTAPSLWVVPEGMDEAHAPIWNLDWDLACALVDMMVGSADPVERPSTSAVTKLESALLSHVCEEMYNVWAAVWPLKIASPAPWRCVKAVPGQTGPEPSEWVRLTFELSGGRLSGRFDVYIPIRLARLPDPRSRKGRALSGAVSTARVRTAPVTASVRLATWKTTVRDLQALKPGDVIDLGISREDALSFRIAQHEKFMVRPGIRNGKISVQVVQAKPEDEPLWQPLSQG